ncbi:MAG TPA: CmpA/NrtA family ABC transporter substrate-binding protein, partial [Vicinamibacterales bacterium]
MTGRHNERACAPPLGLARPRRGVATAATAVAAALCVSCGSGTPPAGSATAATASPTVATTALEKPQLKLGFIKLTDMAPLAIAYEKGYFEEEGLSVTLEAQANWKVLLDRVIDGELDGAHMLAGQPLAATIGYGTSAEVVTAFSMDLNGNAITVSNEVWQQMQPHLAKDANGRVVRPVHASALKPVVTQYRAAGTPFRMGMVFPVSTHNY